MIASSTLHVQCSAWPQALPPTETDAPCEKLQNEYPEEDGMRAECRWGLMLGRRGIGELGVGNGLDWALGLQDTRKRSFKAA